MDLFKRSVKTFFWTFTGSILGFLFQLYAASVLGASEYGKANFILGISGTLFVFTSLGLPTLLVREVSRFKSRSKEILSKIFSAQVLIDLLSFPMIILVTLEFLKKTDLESFVYISLTVSILVATQISRIASFYYNGLRKQDFSSFITNFLSKLIKISVFVIFLFLSKTDHISFLIASLASLLPGAFLIFLNLKGFRFRGFIEILKSSWQFYVISVMYSLYSNFSKVLQRMYSGNEEVGVLSVGMILGTIGTLLGMTFATVAMPEFASAWKDRDIERIDKVFKDVSRWNAYIMLPVVIFFMINLENILSFLGKDYLQGKVIVGIILLAQFFNSLVGPNGTLLNMSGYQRYEIYNGAAMIATAFLSGLILGPKVKWGIALSLAVSIFVVNLLKLFEVRNIFGIYPYTKKVLLHISFITMISTLLSLVRLENITIWIIYSILWISGVITLCFISSPEREDREMVKKLMKKLGIL